MYILNAFSPNMLSMFPANVLFEEISLDEAQALAATDLESAVGHASTAAVFAAELGVEVPANRISVSLNKGVEVLVGQYRGPRLEEGVTTLPEEATIVWLRVTISCS